MVLMIDKKLPQKMILSFFKLQFWWKRVFFKLIELWDYV